MGLSRYFERNRRRAALLAGSLLLVTALSACSLRTGSSSPPVGQPEASSSVSQSASSSAVSSAIGSAAVSGSASSSASSSAAQARENGQLGLIFEVNNLGWQKVINSTNKRGMVVVMIIPNQPAAKAGLVEGDVVTKLNGVDIWNANTTNREIRKLKVGDKVSLDVERKNGPAKVDLTVEKATQLDLPGMLNDLVKKDANNARAYFLRAAYGTKDAKQAVADYSKAIDLKGDFVSAYVQRGTLMERAEADKAMKDFDKAISLDPAYEPAYVNRSVLFSTQKAYDKALADSKKAVELDPTDPAAYTNLGIGYINTGDRAQAMAAEEKALQADPQFGPALFYRGLMYRDASRVDLENAVRYLRDDNLRATAQAILQKMAP